MQQKEFKLHSDREEDQQAQAQDPHASQHLVLKANKDFITAVARHGLSPARDHIKIVQVMEAYNDLDPTLEAVVACATCSRPFETPFKTILAYCQDKNLF